VAAIDGLPPDQRAVLSLLLAQGKSYEDLARMLRLDPDAVRARAHSALSTLGPRSGTAPGPERQEAIADYLLGQQAVSERAATRARLESSAADRAWARVVAAELRPVAGDNLPEIPAEAAEMDEAFDALHARTEVRAHARRSSRVGGIVLLIGLGVILAVVLVLVLSSGDDDSGTSGTLDASTSTQTTTGTEPLGQANLRGGGKAIGVATLVRRNGVPAMVLVGQGLPKCGRKFAYAVWLYNSPSDSRLLGFVTSNDTKYDTCLRKGKRLEGASGLPDNFSRYRDVLVSRESGTTQPTRPGPIVLRGSVTRAGS
jgi:sigma-70-like protein